MWNRLISFYSFQVFYLDLCVSLIFFLCILHVLNFLFNVTVFPQVENTSSEGVEVAGI